MALAAGSRFHFRDTGSLRASRTWLASDAEPSPPWRALDQAVARWVLAHQGSSLLAEVAAWASYAEGQGDTALPLRSATRLGMLALDDAALAELAKQPMLGAAGAPAGDFDTPFVLDGEHFYLRRNFLHEVSIAQQLRARLGAGRPPSRLDDAQLRALFNGSLSDAEAAQRQAVDAAVGKRLFVLTGGPGTGKTSTVLRMLLALVHEHAQTHHCAPRIRLAAPTGKAAQRLAESLRDGGQRMLERPVQAPADWQALPEQWQPQLQVVLGAASTTLHRLLGSRGRHGGFSQHRGNPIAADIVVVDEASMIDLGMLRALLDALREDSLLVLLGDADQLTSVGTGSVLLDVVAALQEQAAPELVRLSHCFRADTALVPVNEAVQQGDTDGFERACEAAGPQRVQRRSIDSRAALQHRLLEWTRLLNASLAEHGAFEPISEGDLAAVERALTGLRQQQLLCALREGEFGAAQVNEVIETQLRARLDGYEAQVWYPGRAVMITRNDYASDLFNGDVGLCLRQRDVDGSERLQVWFEASPSAAVQVRGFAPGSLPTLQGAFALTVHKSQGSEYGRVAVLLPPDPSSPMQSRQLLYTALSRARQSMEIWGSQAATHAALLSPMRRSGLLRQRITLR